MHPKHELVQTYQWLRQYGLNDSHSGNASVRDGDLIWVTPTGACADTLVADDLVACGMDGTVGDGASLDTALHLAVYRANPNATCILHSHGPNTVAITMDGKNFVPPDFEGAYYFSSIPVLTIAYQDYLDESPALVSRTLARHPVAVVRGHGVYACAESINLAYKWTCSLELSAKTALLARQAGTI
ncbi:MAG: class II aldolase/adducin family protein [Acidiferrobacterales bacterium]|nr:class II aldolase/adducin family protein [Acidiferrobacterales bacterium]